MNTAGRQGSAQDSPVRVRRIRAEDWEQLRAIRLRALAMDPTAFGSTLAETLLRPEDYWRDRARTTASSATGALFFASDGETWLGLAGGAIEPDEPDVVELISLWVEPARRRTGVARALCGAVEAWARERGARQLQLWVTEANAPAIRLYERLGFEDTGRRQPVRPGESARECLMTRSL
jgi:ribosomal protein S18 acetylase RimI-like enzyme